jgi:hypothetical protein
MSFFAGQTNTTCHIRITIFIASLYQHPLIKFSGHLTPLKSCPVKPAWVPVTLVLNINLGFGSP